MNNTLASGWRAVTSLGELNSIHSRQHQVGQKQIHPDIVAIDERPAPIRVVRFQHPVVQLAQDFDYIGRTS